MMTGRVSNSCSTCGTSRVTIFLLYFGIVEPEIKDTSYTACSASYLDLHLIIDNEDL
jgi:hypothetical protein